MLLFSAAGTESVPMLHFHSVHLQKCVETHRLRELTCWGKDGEKGSLGSLDGHVHTAAFKMDNQQGPTVQHMSVCSVLCGSLDGSDRYMCVCVAESLCCPSETITTS